MNCYLRNSLIYYYYYFSCNTLATGRRRFPDELFTESDPAERRVAGKESQPCMTSKRLLLLRFPATRCAADSPRPLRDAERSGDRKSSSPHPSPIPSAFRQPTSKRVTGITPVPCPSPARPYAASGSRLHSLSEPRQSGYHPARKCGKAAHSAPESDGGSRRRLPPDPF